MSYIQDCDEDAIFIKNEETGENIFYLPYGEEVDMDRVDDLFCELNKLDEKLQKYKDYDSIIDSINESKEIKLNKERFEFISDYDWWGVIDTTGEIKGDYGSASFSTNRVVDLLNNLANENEKFKYILNCKNNQLILIKKIVDDLGTEEMKRQMEEILDYVGDCYD